MANHTAVQHLGYSLDSLEHELWEILFSIPVAVLHGICGAGLRRRKASDPDMNAWLINNYIKSKNRPCAYTLELTDQIGRAPALGDLMKIVSEVRRYLEPDGSKEGEDLAIRVDSVNRVLTDVERSNSRQSNWRFYLKSQSSRKNLSDLLDSLDDTLADMAQQGYGLDEPMPWALRDVGYTHDGPGRLKAQENLSSGSNLLMSLSSAIAQSHPDFIARAKAQKQLDPDSIPVAYKMHGEIIFLCFRPVHAVLAEAAFSVIGLSYSKDGRGFNTIEAGISVASNNRYELVDWQRWQRDLLEESPLRMNAAADKARIEEMEKAERQSEFLEYNSVLRDIARIGLVHDAFDEMVHACKRAHRR